MYSCLWCQSDLHKPARGPEPTYCSPSCRSAAYREHRQLFGNRVERQRRSLAGLPVPRLGKRPCEVCGVLFPYRPRVTACSTRCRRVVEARSAPPSRKIWDQPPPPKPDPACRECGEPVSAALAWPQAERYGAYVWHQQCYRRRSARLEAEEQRAAEPRSCLLCGVIITPAPNRLGRPKIYCSHACRQRAYRRRRAANLPIALNHVPTATKEHVHA